MDRLLDAMRRFSESRTDQDPQVPHLSRSLEQHARLISERVSLTAIDGGSALIARRSNAAIGIVKIASVRYDHPGMQVHVVRWVVRVFAGEDSFEVSMLCLDSDEERSVAFGALDGDGVMRDPEQGIDLARALLERERQKEAVGLVLADGSLQPRFVEERAACAALEKSVLGIVKKASHARVSAPESMVARFSEPVFAHRIDGSWYCRLHPSSSRIIRVEGAVFDETFDALLVASSDAAIPGYPYALVLADRFARISNRESRSIALESAARYGLDIGSLHDVLDSLER
jgi:hypothetical protein